MGRSARIPSFKKIWVAVLFVLNVCSKTVVIETSPYEWLKILLSRINLSKIELFPTQTITKLYLELFFSFVLILFKKPELKISDILFSFLILINLSSLIFSII